MLLTDRFKGLPRAEQRGLCASSTLQQGSPDPHPSPGSSPCFFSLGFIPVSTSTKQRMRPAKSVAMHHARSSVNSPDGADENQLLGISPSSHLFVQGKPRSHRKPSQETSTLGQLSLQPEMILPTKIRAAADSVGSSKSLLQPRSAG